FHRYPGPWPGLRRPGRDPARQRTRPLAIPAGQDGPAGPAAVAADGAGRAPGRDPGDGADPVPAGVLPEAPGRGERHLLRRRVHAAPDHRPHAAAARRLHGPPPPPAQLRLGLPGRGLAGARLGLPPGQFGLLRTDPVSDEPQPSLAPQVQLSGLDTMRFSTELLPRL